MPRWAETGTSSSLCSAGAKCATSGFFVPACGLSVESVLRWLRCEARESRAAATVDARDVCTTGGMTTGRGILGVMYRQILLAWGPHHLKPHCHWLTAFQRLADKRTRASHIHKFRRYLA